TVVGKQLMRDSAETEKNVSMEIGGHARYIIFADADIDTEVEGVLGSKFSNSGQTCISTNRIIVEDSETKEYRQKLNEKVKKLTVGDGINEETNVVPLINQNAM